MLLFRNMSIEAVGKSGSVVRRIRLTGGRGGGAGYYDAQGGDGGLLSGVKGTDGAVGYLGVYRPGIGGAGPWTEIGSVSIDGQLGAGGRGGINNAQGQAGKGGDGYVEIYY
jgi:hypothetical protein